jgi:hypothetical protein
MPWFPVSRVNRIKPKEKKKERKRGEKAKDAMHVYNNNSIKKKKQKIVCIYKFNS